jgi:N-acyl-L-homoserine lactone synthetase
MSTLEIRLAQSAVELDAVFRLRHDVFASYMRPHADQRIYDRFDAFPVSRNIIALYDEVIVGGTRLTEKTGVSTSADEFYDFADFLPRGPLGAGSMTCVHADYRKIGVGFYLMCMTWHLAQTSGWTHVYGVINPEIKDAMVKMGAEILSKKECYSSEHGLAYFPILVDLARLRRDCQHVINTFSGNHWTTTIENRVQSCASRVDHGLAQVYNEASLVPARHYRQTCAVG